MVSQFNVARDYGASRPGMRWAAAPDEALIARPGMSARARQIDLNMAGHQGRPRGCVKGGRLLDAPVSRLFSSQRLDSASRSWAPPGHPRSAVAHPDVPLQGHVDVAEGVLGRPVQRAGHQAVMASENGGIHGNCEARTASRLLRP